MSQPKEQWIEQKVAELEQEIFVELADTKATDLDPYTGYKIKHITKALNNDIETVLKKKLQDKGWRIDPVFDDGTFKGYYLT